MRHRWIGLAVLAALLGIVSGCASRPAPQAPQEAAEALRVEVAPRDLEWVLDEEAYRSFLFFWEQANRGHGSPGYGLVRDRWPGTPDIASIASVGLGLAALPVGVERGWVPREAARERALDTLRTFSRLEAERGFFFRDLNVGTGRRAQASAISLIDNGLFIAGALVAGSYFGGEVEAVAGTLYEAMDWTGWVDAATRHFWRSSTPEQGFAGHWDSYGEQLVLYVLGAGSPSHPVGRELYDGFTRTGGSYGSGEPFFHSWTGGLFAHQCSHAFIDFRERRDANGVDWFANSVAAVQAQRHYAIDNPLKKTTLGADSWGLSASDTPTGYQELAGAPPSGLGEAERVVDGTVPPSAAIASVAFAPVEAVAAARFYRGFPKLWGRYGFADAYNLDVTPAWFAPDVVGTRKGIGLLMIENARTGLVWRLFMRVPAVMRGLDRLGFVAAP